MIVSRIHIAIDEAYIEIKCDSEVETVFCKDISELSDWIWVDGDDYDNRFGYESTKELIRDVTNLLASIDLDDYGYCE